jgi:hypothetical protein
MIRFPSSLLSLDVLEGTFPTNEAARETTGIKPPLATFGWPRARKGSIPRAYPRESTGSESQHTAFSPRSIHVGPTEATP